MAKQNNALGIDFQAIDSSAPIKTRIRGMYIEQIRKSNNAASLNLDFKLIDIKGTNRLHQNSTLRVHRTPIGSRENKPGIKASKNNSLSNKSPKVMSDKIYR